MQVVETCKTKLGADQPTTLNCMNSLALTYRNHQLYDKDHSQDTSKTPYTMYISDEIALREIFRGSRILTAHPHTNGSSRCANLHMTESFALAYFD